MRWTRAGAGSSLTRVPMRLPRWLKYTLAGFAALCAVAAIALVVVVQTIDVDRYARLAITEVKTATGRELVIRGKLDVSLFPRLAVRAEDVSFANATWGSRPRACSRRSASTVRMRCCRCSAARWRSPGSR